MTNLFTLPPSILILQLFRRSRKRQTKSSKLRELLNQKFGKSQRKNESFLTKSKLTFPWWFKIFAYAVSFACMGVSIAFIIFKGIFLNWRILFFRFIKYFKIRYRIWRWKSEKLAYFSNYLISYRNFSNSATTSNLNCYF